MIHSIAQWIETKGKAPEFLQTIGRSAHYFIEPDGTVIETVDPERQAYHAGVSEYKNWSGLNKNFIGIEVMVEGEYFYHEFLERIKQPEAFKFHQYDSTAVLCALLCDEYDIDPDNIVSHNDVSGPDVRPNDPKYDVGSGFDWDHFMDLTKEFIRQLNEAS